MPTDLLIRCRCGAVRGVVRGASCKTGNRVICYCDDCQTFANFLSTAGQILDAHGGTDVFMISPARLKITQGIDRLACVRVTPKGPLRWYTDCCKTPIGNTPPTSKLPFVGLIHSCMDPESRSLNQVIGHVRSHAMAQYARGDLAGINTYKRFPLYNQALIIWKIFIWRIRGDDKHSPFFDPKTGDPVSSPQFLGNNQRSGRHTSIY